MSPADFPLLCSALLQLPHWTDRSRSQGGHPHLHHVTIHLLLQWESCGVLVLLPEHQQHHWREGEYKYCSTVGRYGANYQVVAELNVEAEPGRDSCLSGSPTDRQCCVTRNLAAENQFEVNSSYLYGVVDLPDGPDMIQTHVSVGHPGYVFTTAVYTQSGGTLRKSAW